MDDGGLQYWQQLGQQEEYESWLKDMQSQDEYQQFLDSLNRKESEHAIQG